MEPAFESSPAPARPRIITRVVPKPGPQLAVVARFALASKAPPSRDAELSAILDQRLRIDETGKGR